MPGWARIRTPKFLPRAFDGKHPIDAGTLGVAATLPGGDVGAIVQREMSRGELARALRTIAACKYRPPGGRVSKQYSLATLERWFYAYRRGGLEALRPAPRSDRGRARDLTAEQRQLLLDIRREHPTASVPLILRTLVAGGRLARGTVSPTTVQRLYREAGLTRGVRPDGHTRLRWQAEHPGALWHGDVCHGPSLRVGQTTKPLRIHALLDDGSAWLAKSPGGDCRRWACCWLDAGSAQGAHKAA